jgi:hypothetical protein
VSYVNSLPYSYRDMDPVREAYRIVASYKGWTPDQISRWEAFIVDDVIRKESGGCWNVMGNAKYLHHDGAGCILKKQGNRSDAGFFQLIRPYWYGPNGYLCKEFGACGREAIIGSPWTSMWWGLEAIEFDGSRPWCYNAKARRAHHLCSTVPRKFE